MSLKINIIKILFIGMLIQLLCGCGQNKQLKTESDVKILEARLDSLIKTVDSNKSILDRMIVKRSKEDNSSILLDVASLNGYQKLDTPTGFFLITISDVKPYLDGYKVFLEIGNPFFITYRGIKCQVKWGTTLDSFKTENFKEWMNGLHIKEINLTQDIKPGSWNKAQLALVPARSDELGYLELAIETDQVAMIK